MQTIEADNVRSAYKIGMQYLAVAGRYEKSRAGDVIVAPGPVTTAYRYPQQRVLLNEARDANPFFHFFEGIWMLSGAEDGSFLNQYVSDFTQRFADGTTLHGAYGYRWRRQFSIDQLILVIGLLRANPQDRRAVITMWNPETDLGVAKKDIPCNTNIFLRVNHGGLDMMVNCRSNDIIWGAYGANAVHFSMLQEYLAAAIGVDIGTLYQNSWNFHAYKDVFDQKIGAVNDLTWCAPYEAITVPLVETPECFLEDCEAWVRGDVDDAKNHIFAQVAYPMSMAHRLYKERDFEHALGWCSMIEAGDWSLACGQWIERRIKAREVRKDAGENQP